MAKTIYVFPNPYAHLDHRGWLAGGCPEAEGKRSPSALPALRKIGARMVMVDGSYNANEAEGRGRGGPLQPRAEYEWVFDAKAPIALNVSVDLEPFYASRARGKDIFVLDLEGSPDRLDVPFEALANARIAAIAQFRAERGANAEVPVEKWRKQFPLDAMVEQMAKAISESRAAEAAANAAAAKDKAKAAEDKAKAEAEKLDAATKSALEKAMAKVQPAAAPKTTKKES